MASRMRSRPVLGSARSPASPTKGVGETSKYGCVASHSMWLAVRIARGPKRAPGRLVTEPSQQTPATANGCAEEALAAPRKPACERYGNAVMSDLRAERQRLGRPEAG